MLVDAAPVDDSGVDPVEAFGAPVVPVEAFGAPVVPVVNRPPVDPVVGAGQEDLTSKGADTAAKFLYPFL